MKAVCKTNCTVPGRGLVHPGEVIDVPEADIEKYPYLKFFDVPRMNKDQKESDAKDASAAKARAGKGKKTKNIDI